MDILIVHSCPDLLNGIIIEIHAEDLLTIPAQGAEMFFEDPGKMFLQQGVFLRFRIMDQLRAVFQFLRVEEIFLPFLYPDVLAYSIKVGSEFTGKDELMGPDAVINDDHGLLEHILGMFPVPLVVYDKSFDDREIGLVHILKDRRIMVPDTLDNGFFTGDLHFEKGIKKGRQFSPPAKIAVVLVSL